MIARPPAGTPRTYRFPDFVRHQLPSGLGVWLVPLAERELVSVHLVTDAGAATEDEAQAGIAALTAQLLVTGTERLDAATFAETTERLGISVGSESTWDSARAGFTALGSKLDDGLALLAEMILTPRLDAGEFERLKGERLNDILQARADPGRLAEESFLREVYAPDVPYGRLAAGVPESVRALDVASARAFHDAHYAPGVAHLVIAGAIDPDVALAAAERHLADWSGAGTGHRTFEPRQRGGRRVVLVNRPGSVQSELRVGHVGIDRHHPAYVPALVMAALLGGVFGSRLNRRLREELGYTYGARCTFDPRRAAGPFTASAAVQTEVTVDAIRELLGQLERIRSEPPDEAELAAVRDFLVGVFPLRFETTPGIAAAIEPLAVYGLPDDYWQTYRSRLEAVTVDDVLAAARDLVRPDDALILVTGDASRVRDELAAADLGPLEVVPAA
ncbi:MAG TPA: pitrilysin family protein [Candidatus Binatia bacterium]|nr:pitrilysin family protein [Candidatus Binatia bacterium]